MNKPAKRLLPTLLVDVVWVTFSVHLVVGAFEAYKKREPKHEKEARESDPQQHSAEAGNNPPSGDPKKDATSDDKTQEEPVPASEPAAANNDKAPPPGKDED